MCCNCHKAHGKEYRTRNGRKYVLCHKCYSDLQRDFLKRQRANARQEAKVVKFSTTDRVIDGSEEWVE